MLDFPLTGARVMLRPFLPSDAEAMHAVYSDPEVMRWVGEGPVGPLGQTQGMLADYIVHQRAHGFSVWAVGERRSGALIGDAGLYTTAQGVELGYTLARPFWGEGYGTEVARLCLDAAFGPLDLGELMATVRPENAGSSRVLAKLGFSRDGSVHVYGAEHWRYRLAAPGSSGAGA